MVLMRKLFALLWLGIVPLPAFAQTFQFDTPIAGDVVPVEIVLAEGAQGVDVTISIEPGTGDLLGFFANLADETVLPSLSVLDEIGVVTDALIAANDVSKVGGGNNVNPIQRWDIGVRLGRAGSADGPITSATFTLRSSEVGSGALLAMLTGADNEGFVFGVRIQSTTGAEGSSKMGMMMTMAETAVEILSPMDQALLNTTLVDVSGLVSGADQVEVSALNAVQATLADGAFMATGVMLQEGLNTITATAVGDGGTVTDSVEVRVDTTPPSVVIVDPADGSVTNASVVLLVGLATDENGIASVRVNGVPVTPDENGLFELEVDLVPGENAIFVEAIDAAGNVGNAVVTVTRNENQNA